MKTKSPQRNDYLKTLQLIKQRISSAQLKAVMRVNQELLKLYWDIGKIITEKQEKSNWGDAVVEQLSVDLKKAFPSIKGFSRTNLFSMRQWFLFYRRSSKKVQQLVGQIPWGHNVAIVNSAKNSQEAIFYLQQILINNWSRNVLLHHIELGLFNRQGKAISNFKRALPGTHSDLATQAFKDPYVFDFMNLTRRMKERELQNNLVQNLARFLLELGKGFAYIGQEYPLRIRGKDYPVDIFFYHLILRCFIIIDLKTGEFKPEYAGKMNFYLSAVDDMLRRKGDNPSIGLILCHTKDDVMVEYSLKDLSKPIGVSSYRLVTSIPKALLKQLPTKEELKRGLFPKKKS
ncbi:MAG TPA: PDDEXK nuclease domain-containing protein [Chitinophagales bacterium]|nr:PDDEXK nuclease domain-containing protein [Chitinophagales bacterium]